MLNLLTNAFKRRHKGTSAPASRPSAPTVVKRSRLALKRYFIYSSGVASIALGIAVLVTVLAVNYTSSELPGVALAQAEAKKPPLVIQYAQVSSRQTELDAVMFDAPPLPSPTPEPTRNPVPPRAPLPSNLQINRAISNVNITFYDCLDGGFCGHMYNGEPVYEGAAACSWNLPIGTSFYILGDPTARVYVCKDRGLLADTWVDIFWHNPKDGYVWQANVGRYGTIAIVSLP
jgi:hypothetical protein